MAKKTTARVKSAEEIAQETEFYRRRSLPAVDVRYVGAGKHFEVVLYHHQLGEIGRKTEIARRGVVVSVSYFLPKVEPRTYGDVTVSIGGPS